MLRDYYNEQITMYFQRKNIQYHFYHSKKSDYYFILNIKGRDNNTLKIRISNHSSKKEYDLPFLCFWYNKTKMYPKKHTICCQIGEYIAKYKIK